jgi:flavin-dependent dehydrogenase
METGHFDVIVIGGGPAGSTAGTLLAKHGWKVLILEKEKFPRFKIGESMLPGSLRTLDRMGVKKKIDAADVVIKRGGRIISGCGDKTNEFLFNDVFRCVQATSYQVKRALFDKILLDHTAENGCTVKQETAVKEISFDQDGVTVTTSTGAGFRAGYVVDCSGRASLLGSKFRLKKSYSHLKKVALFAHFEDVAIGSDEDLALTHMVRGENKWFWLIPINKVKTSIGVVMDSHEFKRMKLDPERAFEKICDSYPPLVDRLKNARRVMPVQTTSDYSYRNRRFTGDRWISAGDAAGFIDPVWSSGVYIAILSGEKAAYALNRVMRAPEKKAREFGNFERRIHRVMDLYLKFVTSWYTPQFGEVFFNPKEFLRLVPAVNSILAGDDRGLFEVRWRIWVFHLLTFLQGKFKIVAPKMNFEPMP